VPKDIICLANSLSLSRFSSMILSNGLRATLSTGVTDATLPLVSLGMQKFSFHFML
jgi:hypothetical protein